MFRRTPLKFESFLSKKNEFIHFSHITEQDVQIIWRRPEEKGYSEEELKTLVYHWNNPLWTKMVFRLRQAEGHAVNLWNGLDPNNRNTLLRTFRLGEMSNYVEFFQWLHSTLGVYDIALLELGKVESEKDFNNEHCALWKANEIVYFYQLPEEKQRQLINRYNEEIIKPYQKEYNELNMSNEDLAFFRNEYDVLN